MGLPIFTTADDVKTLVAYLRNKPTGAQLEEIKSVLGRRIIDGRKLTAFTGWALVERAGDRLTLSTTGWKIARSAGLETQRCYRSILYDIAPYRALIEWAYHQSMPEVSNVDIAAQWHMHFSSVVGTDNENTIKDMAVAFGHLAELAGLGELRAGRRGQSTRLVLDAGAVQEFVQGSPGLNGHEERLAEYTVADSESIEIVESGAQVHAGLEGQGLPSAAKPVRVFISHGKNMAIVEQVKTMLGLADMECEVAVEEESTAIPVPQKVLEAMRRCDAAIICVTSEGAESGDVGAGQGRVNENVLIEIGAAFVLYDKRVVLVWDKELQVPTNLQGLYRCELAANELSWSEGMKLMKAMQGFKSST